MHIFNFQKLESPSNSYFFLSIKSNLPHFHITSFLQVTPHCVNNIEIICFVALKHNNKIRLYTCNRKILNTIFKFCERIIIIINYIQFGNKFALAFTTAFTLQAVLILLKNPLVQIISKLKSKCVFRDF